VRVGLLRAPVPDRARPFVIAAVAYAALTLALTFPLILHLTSVVPSDLGDPLLSTSILWWNAHVLPLTERWWNGFAFAPARGMLAFSDHRLGVSLIATPLQWLGASPLTAYNIVFLATFPLCALGAHALGYTLTRRHDAAAVCGLSYGFNPFRISHLSHLELLAAFAMPVALLALHQFLHERRTKWIVVFTLALVVQGLCATYYLLFFFVLVGLWMLWFVRDWRAFAFIALGCAASVSALSPIVIGYRRIHAFHGFFRRPEEIASYGADLASFVTGSPRLWLWGFTGHVTAGAERELFPGLTVVVLVVLGSLFALRRQPAENGRWRRTSLALLLASIATACVALSFIVFGRWSLGAGGLRLLVTDSYKPASIATLLLVAAFAFRPSVQSLWHRRSVFAFYVLAAVACFVCALGPAPTFLDAPILYRPPYSWLMALPVFGNGVRVPARFAMPAVLALAAAAALAFDHLSVGSKARRAIAVAVLAGIALDGWMKPIDLLTPPSSWSLPQRYAFGTVIELPLGTDFGDFEAMYRATLHGHPVANGQSGFFPAHYEALRMAFADGNPRGLDALAQPLPLLVVVDRLADSKGRWNHIVEQAERITRLGADDRWTFYGLAPPARLTCREPEIPLVSAVYKGSPVDLRLITDGNTETAWGSPMPQQFDDAMQIDVGRESRLCALRVSLGTIWNSYPRDLEVTTSADGATWTRQFKGSTAGLMVRGAIDDPHNIWMTMPLHDASARYIRMRLDAGHPTATWIIAEIRVTGK
jgi:F5/8 type C domain-containing protein